MRLCFLGNANSIHTQRWVKYFAQRGYDTHLISYGPCNVSLDNVKLYSLPETKNNCLAFIQRYFEVRNLIKKINPDLLHAHYISGYGWLGMLSGFHPFVVSAWGSDVLIDPNTSGISKMLAKKVLDKADWISCDGENLKEAIVQLGTSHEKITIILFGIDTNKFKPSKRDAKFRKNLVGSDSQIVISIRNLDPVYDIRTLINAMPLILKRCPDTKFVLAGRGEEENSLKELVRSLEISDSILFTGHVSHEKLPEYLASSDVYVSTSLSDGGVAISTFEAMACGLAPVVTDVGDNKKWICDGENGFVIPVKDFESLAKKIIYLLENKAIRKRFGEANRKIIEKKADYFTEMEKMDRIYKELITRYKI